MKSSAACGTKSSPTPSRSFGSSVTPSITPSKSYVAAPSSSESSNGDLWIVLVVAMVVVVIVIIILGIGGFIYYKKKKAKEYNYDAY